MSLALIGKVETGKGAKRAVVKKVCKDEGLVKDSFAEECDINNIVSRFDKTGMVSRLNSKEPFYGDVSDIVGYKEALDIVNNANELFMNMSADIRLRFKNNPEEMINFLNNPENKAEAIKLGMIMDEPKAIPEVPVVPNP